MAMDNEKRDYNYDIQKLLLQFMISDPDLFIRCRNIIKPTYWTEKLRPACKYIISYADEYKTLPTIEHIKAESNVDLNTLDMDTVVTHSQWFLDTIEDFCKHKSMEELIYDGPQLIIDGNYSELERRSKENMMISLQTDLGTDYFANPLERLERMRDRSDMMSTGWRDVDRVLFGGLNRGEVTYFAGPSGSGKSLFLQNIAVNWIQMGLNVIYISLELSEELVGLRIDAMITDNSTKQIMRNFNEAATKVSMLYKRNNWGKLIIKKMPISGTTVNNLRAYVKELEIQTNIKIDAVCVDYLDPLYPNNKKVNPSDLFIKDKYTSEELRDFASDLNIYVVTASQLNRSATNEADLDHSHISGGLSKIQVSDNLIAIYVTPEMKNRGEYQLQFLKTRSSSGVGSKVFIKYNPETMRMTDMEEEEMMRNAGFAGVRNDLINMKNQTIIKNDNSDSEDDNTDQDIINKGSRLRNLLRNNNS